MKPITELDKPSLLDKTSVFSTINIAIADSDNKLAILTKNILSTLGCNHIFIVHNGYEVLQLMKEEQVDILITDWKLKGLNGLDLTTHLRHSLESPNRMIPIVMLTGRNERHDIQQARDAGVTEFVVKPYSAKTLMERLYDIVEHPRSFILCKSYVGPDRRRISSLTLPPDPDENRAYFERKSPLIVPKDQLNQMILDDLPRMIMPDYSLKQKIGFDVPKELIINPLTLANSEDEINAVRDDFIHSMMKDIHLMETSYQHLVQFPDDSDTLIQNIRDSADSIKTRAGIFGFTRATEVATQLYNFCRKYYSKNNKYHLVILEKHIQTIAAIFAEKVVGDGGEIGKDLMKDLARLINRYLNRVD